MKVRINNRLIISEPTDEVKAYCKEQLVLDNPNYYKKAQMGKWTGNTPEKIWLYEVMGNELWLPFGCLQDIWNLHPIAADFINEISPIESRQYDSSIELRPYQEKAVETVIKGKNGVLVMPCGSGKTQCGLEIIARIGGRALWLTHTQDLLTQSKERAENVLNQGGYGTITAGKVNVGSHITFATVQTLAQRIDIMDFTNQFDVIIVDECQHCAGTPTSVTQFYKVISRLSARYKIGLTATPERADRLQDSMFALLGPKIYEVPQEEVADMLCPVKVQIVETGYMPDIEAIVKGDGTIDNNKAINYMINDENRYNVIFEYILHINSMLVLGNRLEYLQRMCDDAVAHGKKAIFLSGRMKNKEAKAERKAALEKLNNGELDIIFATYLLAKEGLDVPNLRYVMFSTPEKDKTTIIQSVGRVRRKAEGKSCGVVIDFVDDFVMYQNYYKKRIGCYEKIGAEVFE